MPSIHPLNSEINILMRLLYEAKILWITETVLKANKKSDVETNAEQLNTWRSCMSLKK